MRINKKTKKKGKKNRRKVTNDYKEKDIDTQTERKWGDR
jgi:hypothetical protein